MDRYESLEEALLQEIREASWDHSPQEDERFGRSALRSFRLQCSLIPTYAAYVRHLGHDPERVALWRDIPPVPASAFKSHDLSAAPADASGAVVFETSGTTISRPGRVRLSSTRLYEASLLSNFRRHLLPEGVRLRTLVFGPTRAEAPHSSLWFMVDRVVGELTADAIYVVRSGDPDWKIADEALARSAAGDGPLLLIGTTLLLLAYLERLRLVDRSFALPAPSRVMDTGGMKGEQFEFSRRDVEDALESRLRIPAAGVVNEYGMAELSSQFYDDNWLAAHERRAPEPGKRIPPWVRTRVLDTETMREVPDGEPGLLVHYDMANLEIPLAIQTEDIGRRVGDRLMLEGRLLGAEARGCSLTFERFLSREDA